MAEYIEQSILEEPTNVVYISELCEKFSYFMEKPGLEKIKCLSNVLKACLIGTLVKNFAVEYSDRTGPQPLLLRSGGVHEIPGCYSVSQRLVFLWSLAQINTLDSALFSREKDAPQSIPGWSGFCIVAQSDQIIRQVTFGIYWSYPPLLLSCLQCILCWCVHW